jgi:uncharacterized protein (DUF1499 family)
VIAPASIAGVKRLLLLATALGACIFLATRWPLVDQVETGRSPGYPALKAREYRAGEEQVAKAVKAAIGRLPRWRFVGAGSGPGGHALQAVYETPIPGLAHDVTVKVKRAGALTRVDVKSKSRKGPVDFGQNARVIEALFEALDRELQK